MKFLAKLARKIGNKSDDEAVEIVKSEASKLPPPRRVTEDVAPPMVAPMPPPNRISVPITEPPPTAMPSYIGQMENVYQNMRRPSYSEATAIEDPTLPTGGEIRNLRYPDFAPDIPAPRRMTPDMNAGMPPLPTGAPPIAPPVRRVMVGENYAGMTPAERAQAKLRVLTDSSAQSKVKDTGEGYEVAPPQKMSRLSGMGRGFALRAPAGASNGLGGMAGAGLVGLIEGLISPGRVQKGIRQQEIGAAESNVAAAQGLEAQGLQNQTRRIQNLSTLSNLGNEEEDRARQTEQQQSGEYYRGLNVIGDMQKAQSMLDPKSQEYAAANAAIQKEAERLSKRSGREVSVIPGNPKLNQLPKLVVDGEVVQQQYDGSMKSIYGTPKSADVDADADTKSTYEWQVKNTENEAKRTAATEAAKGFEEAAADHQKKVTATAGQISELDKQMSAMSSRDPALGPLKRQREQLKQLQSYEQKQMDDAYEKAKTEKAKATSIPSLPPPPRRSKRAAAPSSRILPRSNLSAAAERLIKQGAITNAAQAEAYLRGQGVTIQ